jgi:hypothetical protein
MRKLIVFIDDDRGPIVYYEMALRDAGFDVIRIDTFEGALGFIEHPIREPHFWIVDVMMSIRNSDLCVDGVPVVKSTNMGLAAGLLLYRKIKEADLEVPAMLLTSIATPSLIENIENSLLGDDTCEAKLDLLPLELVSVVKQRLR